MLQFCVLQPNYAILVSTGSVANRPSGAPEALFVDLVGSSEALQVERYIVNAWVLQMLLMPDD